MPASLRHLVGAVRQLRGRCPGCGSEGAQLASCRACHGYQGPFPASDETRRRWAARFATTVAAPRPELATSRAARWSPAR